MVMTNIFSETEARRKVCEKGPFTVVEYDRDMSVDENNAMQMYFASKMNLRKRQVVATLKNSAITVQAGAMQIMMGDVSAATDVSGAGDLLKKVVSSKVTGETIIKPRYEGTGVVILEPVYKYVLLEDISEWPDGMIIEDGLFLACEESVESSVVMRSTLSSAVLGGEGLFNTILKGKGVVALESTVPRAELIVVDMVDDVLKIDGNMAIAWSGSLRFTVEKTTRTLVGSMTSGEGFVNVFRGTGKVLIGTVRKESKE